MRRGIFGEWSFRKKRDGNTEVTEGRTQRSQRRGRGKREANHRISGKIAEFTAKRHTSERQDKAREMLGKASPLKG
jgi:hypothetical protein